MKTLFNRLLFDQVNLDSAALIMKGSVVHMMHDWGEYHGEVTRNNRITGNFRLLVNENYTEKQATIDLNSLESQQGKNTFTLAVEGYCVFYVAEGPGGYAVSLTSAGKERVIKPFTSRELADGDVFTASLIRPGIYTVMNRANNTAMEIAVPYPKRAGAKPVFKPAAIECNAKGFNPGKAEVQAGCGIIFSVKTPAHITIELSKPIDKPEFYATPADVPRSVERKALAVLNSIGKTELLIKYMDTGKGEEQNKLFAEKISGIKEKTGRIDNIQQLFALEKFSSAEYTKIINTLYNAYSQLTDSARFKKAR